MKTLGLLITILFLAQCVVPYESARMLPKDAVEIKAGFTSVSGHADGDSEHFNNGLGLGLGYGITDRINLKARYERVIVDDDYLGESIGVNYLSFGPKFGIVPGKFAVALPIGAYFYEGEDSWTINPMAMYTYSKNNKVEGTIGSRLDIFLDNEAEDEMLLGFNLGLGLSKDLDQWAIRPDLGFVFNPGEDGFILTFGVGVNYTIK